MNNLHFIPNNIFTKIFKELIKSKNDYQQYLNYMGAIWTTVAFTLAQVAFFLLIHGTIHELVK